MRILDKIVGNRAKGNDQAKSFENRMAEKIKW